MSRSGENWYPQNPKQNFVQKILKKIKLCFTDEDEIDTVYVSKVYQDDYGSIRDR